MIVIWGDEILEQEDSVDLISSWSSEEEILILGHFKNMYLLAGLKDFKKKKLNDSKDIPIYQYNSDKLTTGLKVYSDQPDKVILEELLPIMGDFNYKRKGFETGNMDTMKWCKSKDSELICNIDDIGIIAPELEKLKHYIKDKTKINNSKEMKLLVDFKKPELVQGVFKKDDGWKHHLEIQGDDKNTLEKFNQIIYDIDFNVKEVLISAPNLTGCDLTVSTEQPSSWINLKDLELEELKSYIDSHFNMLKYTIFMEDIRMLILCKNKQCKNYLNALGLPKAIIKECS